MPTEQNLTSPRGHRIQVLKVLAWLNLFICLGLFAAAMALYFVNQPAPAWRHTIDLEVWTLSVLAILFPVVGLLILVNQPRHLIGWLLGAIGLITAISVLATQFAIYGFYTQPLASPLPAVALWLRGWLWIPVIFLICFFLLLFPTGRLSTSHWRWVAYGLLLTMGALTIVNLAGLANLPTTFTSAPTNSPPWDQIIGLLVVSLPLWLLISVLALLLRWRKADVLVRQQIKWVAFAGILLGATVLLGDWVVERIWQDPTARIVAGRGLMSIAFAALVIAILIAILRYRLFDIDVIIRKTTSYAILTALLALVYFGSIVVLQQLLGALTGESDVAVVLSTLLIAALFLPLRRWVQDAIDRRFFRRKYDAEKVMQQFAAAARDETDLDALTAELLRVIQETMEPEGVSIWLKPTADGKKLTPGR